jgi:hypothetical protein
MSIITSRHIDYSKGISLDYIVGCECRAGAAVAFVCV